MTVGLSVKLATTETCITCHVHGAVFVNVQARLSTEPNVVNRSASDATVANSSQSLVTSVIGVANYVRRYTVQKAVNRIAERVISGISSKSDVLCAARPVLLAYELTQERRSADHVTIVISIADPRSGARVAEKCELLSSVLQRVRQSAIAVTVATSDTDVVRHAERFDP